MSCHFSISSRILPMDRDDVEASLQVSFPVCFLECVMSPHGSIVDVRLLIIIEGFLRLSWLPQHSRMLLLVLNNNAPGHSFLSFHWWRCLGVLLCPCLVGLIFTFLFPAHSVLW